VKNVKPQTEIRVCALCLGVAPWILRPCEMRRCPREFVTLDKLADQNVAREIEAAVEYRRAHPIADDRPAGGLWSHSGRDHGPREGLLGVTDDDTERRKEHAEY
jgi:hypothetical protein